MSCLLAEHMPYKGKVRAARRTGIGEGVCGRFQIVVSELHNHHCHDLMQRLFLVFASSYCSCGLDGRCPLGSAIRKEPPKRVVLAAAAEFFFQSAVTLSRCRRGTRSFRRHFDRWSRPQSAILHKHNAFSEISEGAQFAGLGETVLVSCDGTSPPAALLGENFR